MLRSDYFGDPLISTIDKSDCWDANGIDCLLYREDSQTGKTNILREHNGADVYIKTCAYEAIAAG